MFVAPVPAQVTLPPEQAPASRTLNDQTVSITCGRLLPNIM
jgi:hypothetical protein